MQKKHEQFDVAHLTVYVEVRASCAQKTHKGIYFSPVSPQSDDAGAFLGANAQQSIWFHLFLAVNRLV